MKKTTPMNPGSSEPRAPVTAPVMNENLELPFWLSVELFREIGLV